MPGLEPQQGRELVAELQAEGLAAGLRLELAYQRRALWPPLLETTCALAKDPGRSRTFYYDDLEAHWGPLRPRAFWSSSLARRMQRSSRRAPRRSS